MRVGARHLQHGPNYEAVSYTWADAVGDDSLTGTITHNTTDQSISITKNCEMALRRLRKPRSDRRLWVDAVCIDQSNVQERNHQVKNMIAIFRSALRVLVYLGQGDSTLHRLVDYIADDTAGQLPQLLDFVSLFQSRWFHRVWVLQEIAVAKDILVIYGEKLLSWNDVLEHSNLYLRLMAAHNLPLVIPPVISFGLLQTTSSSQRLQGKTDLLSLLQASRNCSCKDPRDKVYAILGLLHNGPELPLRADYSSSTTAGWVYFQAAAWHIATTRSLEILSLVDGSSPMDIPSWVPDWTKTSPASLPTQLQMRQCTSRPPLIGIDGDVLPRFLQSYPVISTLRVTGRRCGTVWTDKRIFHDGTTDSNHASNKSKRSTRGHKGSNKPRDNSGLHWLHFPSHIYCQKHCDDKLQFWGKVLPAYSRFIPRREAKAYTTFVQADIPPSFAGPCRACSLRRSGRGLQPSCSESPDLPCQHYNDPELRDFLAKLNQYGMGRRIFGTDHSLGLGPTDIENWDEVWILEGATVPFILRRVDKYYKLVGACYIQAVNRTFDRCSICSHKTVRQEYTSRPQRKAKIEDPPRTPAETPSEGTTTTSSLLSSVVSSSNKLRKLQWGRYSQYWLTAEPWIELVQRNLTSESLTSTATATGAEPRSAERGLNILPTAVSEWIVDEEPILQCTLGDSEQLELL